MEHVLLLVELGVILNHTLRLIDKVVQHGLKFQDASRVTRVHQMHSLLKVKQGDIWEGLVLCGSGTSVSEEHLLLLLLRLCTLWLLQAARVHWLLLVHHHVLRLDVLLVRCRLVEQI